VIERSAETPEALATAMAAAGCDPVDDLAHLCEKAASSPKPRSTKTKVGLARRHS